MSRPLKALREWALRWVLEVLPWMAIGGVVAVVVIMSGRPSAPAVEQAVKAQEARVVRMLDLTITDKNTTGRRQRFTCEPVGAPTSGAQSFQCYPTPSAGQARIRVGAP